MFRWVVRLYHGWPEALGWLFGLLLLSVVGLYSCAANACDTQSTARKAHPTAHLYHSKGCWHTRSADRHPNAPQRSATVRARTGAPYASADLSTSYWPDHTHDAEFRNWLVESAKADFTRAMAKWLLAQRIERARLQNGR